MLNIKTNTKAGNGLPLYAFMSAVDELRKLDPELQLQTVKVFLLVAQRPGILQGDIADLANISQAACSRNAHALGKRHRSGKRGLGLIVQRCDKADIRKVRLYLTDKGKALAARLTDCAAGEPDGVRVNTGAISQTAQQMRSQLSL